MAENVDSTQMVAIQANLLPRVHTLYDNNKYAPAMEH